MIKIAKFVHRTVFLLFICVVFSHALIDWNFGPESNIVFHAYIVEKTQDVYVHPPLTVTLSKGSQLCHLYLLPTETHSVPQFIETIVLDSYRGLGGLTYNESVLYTSRKHISGILDPAVQGLGVYHLKIFAEDCSHPAHTTRPWTINIVLIPTEKPVWSTSHYQFQISSNQAPGSVVGKVTAYAALGLDERPGQWMGDDTGMCNYAIDDPGHSYFDMDGHGVIRSRVHFEKWSNTDYQFNVTGFDCVTPVANRATVPVSIHVQPGCVAGWRNIPELLDFQLISMDKAVMPQSDFELCHQEVVTSSKSCDLEKAVLRVKLLWTREDAIMDGVSNMDEYITDAQPLCDLDITVLNKQRETCGLDSKYTEDLMNPEVFKKFTNAIHSFNGTYEIPVKTNGQLVAIADHRLDNTWFTLTFWMNHSAGSMKANGPSENSPGDNSRKENIICTSDSEGKNRHHFTIFLQNCKLTVLLRREPEQTTTDSGHSGKPLYLSQWRFVLDEICDNAWHHYAIVHYGDITEMQSSNQLELYLDGFRIPHENNAVQLAEDYALAAISPDRRTPQPTRMTIGACWHGRESKYRQHFQGELADLVLNRGVILTPTQIKCLSSCLPKLYITGQRPTEYSDLSSNLEPDSQVVIESTNLKSLVSAARTIMFHSPRLHYVPRSRPEPYAISVNTMLRFNSDCRKLSIPGHTIHINRLPPELKDIGPNERTPHLSLNLFNPGADRHFQPIEISAASLANGVPIFSSVELHWKPYDSWGDRKIEYCQLSFCQSKIFESGESIIISPEVLNSINAINLATYPNHVTLTGPSTVREMTIAINSLKWLWDRESTSEKLLPETRCFRLFCAAIRDGSPNVHSPFIQTMFTVRKTDEPLSVTVNRALHKSRLQSSIRDKQFTPSKPDNRTTLWEYNSPLYYVILGMALAILIICVLVGTIYICRSRNTTSARRPRPSDRLQTTALIQKLKSKFLPFFEVAVQKRHNPQSNRHTKPEFGRLLMTINPIDAANQSEVDDMNRRRCFYNRECYDDYCTPMDEQQHQ